MFGTSCLPGRVTHGQGENFPSLSQARKSSDFFSTTLILSFFCHDRNILIFFPSTLILTIFVPGSVDGNVCIQNFRKYSHSEKKNDNIPQWEKNDNIPLWSGKKMTIFCDIVIFFSIAEMPYCHFFSSSTGPLRVRPCVCGGKDEKHTSNMTPRNRPPNLNA